MVEMILLSFLVCSEEKQETHVLLWYLQEVKHVFLQIRGIDLTIGTINVIHMFRPPVKTNCLELEHRAMNIE